RIVIGEVRGPEVMSMLEAACDGIAGTLCTLHARSSHQTFEKLVNYARRDGARYDREDVLQTAAYALDLVLYLDRARDGRRVLAEITQVLDYDPSDRRIVTNDWFVPGPDGAAVPNPRAPIPVDVLDLLVEHGYQPELHRDAVGAWCPRWRCSPGSRSSPASRWRSAARGPCRSSRRPGPGGGGRRPRPSGPRPSAAWRCSRCSSPAGPWRRWARAWPSPRSAARARRSLARPRPPTWRRRSRPGPRCCGTRPARPAASRASSDRKST